MIDSDKQALIDNTCMVPTQIIVNNGDGTTTVLTEDDYVLDWEYEDFRYVPNEGFIGQFVERVVNGNLKNVDDSFSIVDKEIEVKFGIKTEQEETISSLDDVNGQNVNHKTINIDFGEYTVEDLLPTNIPESDSFAEIGYENIAIKYLKGSYMYDMGYDFTTFYYPNETLYDKTIENDEYYMILESYELDHNYVLANISQLETYGSITLNEEEDLELYAFDYSKTNYPAMWNSIQFITSAGEVTNWYSLGHFIVNNPNDDNVKDKTSFKAVDYTKYFEKPYEDSLTYPTTAGCMAYASCKQSGVELAGFEATLTQDQTILFGKKYFTYDVVTELYNYVSEPNVEDISTYYELSFDFSNSDFIIDANPFVNNETNRVIMKWIGALAFSWVRVDWDDKCHIDFTQGTTVDEYDEIDNDHYYDLTTTGTIFGEVNKIVIGMKDIEGENVTITDDESENPNECEIAIWDNPLTYTEEKRTEAIVAGEDLYGLKYQDVELTTTGHPWLKGNEKIKIKDMEDNYIYTYPFDRTISYMGHIKTKIKAPAMSITNTTYTYESPIEKRLRNTQIQVDKANSQIQSIVTETIPEINEKLVGTVYTQDLESFRLEVNQTIDTTTTELQEQIDELGGIPEELQNTLVTININGIQVSTNLSKISTLITNNAFKIVPTDNPNEPFAFFGYDEIEGRSKAEMDNLTVKNYFTAGYHRVEGFEEDGEYRTGWFYVGGEQ